MDAPQHVNLQCAPLEVSQGGRGLTGLEVYNVCFYEYQGLEQQYNAGGGGECWGF